MGFAASVFLSDERATDCLGRHLAGALKPGDTLLLDGQIGAGKTHLARAIIQTMLDAPDVHVPSPTYTLVQTYDPPSGPLWHVDLYRLADTSELAELGLDEAIGKDIVLIEWPDRLLTLPSGALHIAFDLQANGRRLTLTSESGDWHRLGELEGATDA